ncbi:hypothetical protein ACIREE_33725 [Streptomyces sp. NPDC102467]|uniref:hypothetical protein n=1 Tax=Streptomyces sp. NPDC102467 TaxID=3366179 RepID=UPI00381D59AB
MTADHTHLERPDLVRLTLEGADPQAVLALAYELTTCHNLTGPSTPDPIPGEQGVRTWQYGYPAVMPYE